MKTLILFSVVVSVLWLAGCSTPSTTKANFEPETTVPEAAPAATAAVVAPVTPAPEAPPTTPAPELPPTTTAPTPVAPTKAAPEPEEETFSVAGHWHWFCCGGQYQGDMELQQDASNKLTGRFYEENDTVGGRIEGSVSGDKVKFTCSWGGGLQREYNLTLSADGKHLKGRFEGARYESADNFFVAMRK